MPRYNAGLSPKQRKFIEHYIETGNGTQSAIKAGYNTANDGVAQVIAAENLLKPLVKDELERHFKKIEVRTSDVIEVLASKLKSDDDVIALKAAELTGKHLRMFTDKADVAQVLERVKSISWDEPEELIEVKSDKK